MKVLQNPKTRRVLIGILVLLLIFAALPGGRRLEKRFRAPVSALLRSREGQLLGARIAADGQWRFPAGDTVPQKFAQALICYEDKRFYHHPGIDPLAVARALFLNLKHGQIRSGASTLTMQTIRLSRGAKRRTWGQKGIEAVLALRLEAGLRKDKILALYAAHAPFGGNVVGLEAAAWRYFGRDARDLSWAESAMLAVLPNAPALIHPGKNRPVLLKKRNALLDKLCQKGIIDAQACALAQDEPLPQAPLPMPHVASHYLESLRQSGGDKLYNSQIDYALQIRIEEVARRHAQIFAANGVGNLALVVMDTHSQEVIAYCGNATALSGPKAGAQVDVARAPRSSGSTLKPFLYAAMLDAGTLLPTQLIADIPFYYKDFTPHNFSHSFDGAVPAYSVIQRSLNVPSVRMLQDYGVDPFLHLLQDLGFSTLTRGAEVYGLSLILGGAEITLADLARAYCQSAARLNALTHSLAASPQVARCPLSAAALWCTFEALAQANRPEEENNWQAFSSSRKVAWKTGTSYGNRDAWSVGVTPDYVVAAWVGNCNGEGRPHLTGIGYAAPLMFDVFNCLPRTGWFAPPYAEMEAVVVCRQSGHPVSDNCLLPGPESVQGEAAAPRTDTLWVPQAPRKIEACPYHKALHLSADGSYIVNSSCYPVSQMKKVGWFVLPPSQEGYYMPLHSSYRQLPPLHPQYGGGTQALPQAVVEIVYPQPGMRLAAPVDLDAKRSGVIFSAAHANPGTPLFWHIDRQYIGSTAQNPHKMRVVPTPGRHTLTVVDPAGNQASLIFYGE